MGKDRKTVHHGERAGKEKERGGNAFPGGGGDGKERGTTSGGSSTSDGSLVILRGAKTYGKKKSCRGHFEDESNEKGNVFPTRPKKKERPHPGEGDFMEKRRTLKEKKGKMYFQLFERRKSSPINIKKNCATSILGRTTASREGSGFSHLLTETPKKLPLGRKRESFSTE